MEATARDRQILKAMADALVATGEFDLVTTAGLPEDGSPFSSDVGRVCALSLDGKPTENQLWCDYLTTSLERIVPISATVMFRAEDADTRDDEADRLFCLVANTIATGNPWLGITVMRKTRMTGGEWVKAMPPEQRYKIPGQFVYRIPSPGGRLADAT